MTAFARRLAAIAEEQHAAFHRVEETDPRLCRQIERYWTDLGLRFSDCVKVPWSAVFVSWCVSKAGATAAEFKFAATHARFVYAAIQNARRGRGVFHGVEIDAEPPAVGDILQSNREGTRHDFHFASTHWRYASHSSIVVAIRRDPAGPSAWTIGGNEADSIRKTATPLTPGGFIAQRAKDPFICLVKNRK